MERYRIEKDVGLYDALTKWTFTGQYSYADDPPRQRWRISGCLTWQALGEA